MIGVGMNHVAQAHCEGVISVLSALASDLNRNPSSRPTFIGSDIVINPPFHDMVSTGE